MGWLIIAGRSKQGRRPPNEKTTTKREKVVSEWERLGEDLYMVETGFFLAARLHNSICRQKITTVGSSLIAGRLHFSL